MASTANAPLDLDGLFKHQYHKKLEKLIPEHVILAKGMDGESALIPWVPADSKNGKDYLVPTVLRSNQGVSYLGESGSEQTLQDATAALMREAVIRATEINVRGRTTYKTLMEAASKGPQAFEAASAWLVEDLQSVAYTRIEIQALHGGDSLGIVESVTAGVGVTSTTLVVSNATFAAGMWPLLEGAKLDFFTGTVLNSTGANVVLRSVDNDTRTLTVDFVNPTTNAAASVTVANEIAVGDTIHFKSARTDGGAYNEFTGLFRQLSATSGTLFGIDRSFSLMRGNVVTAFGKMSKAKLTASLMRAKNKGGNGKYVALVAADSFAVLNAEDMAIRRFDGSYSRKKSESGNEKLSYVIDSCELEVICHPMVKNGQALLFKPEHSIWVGSHKPTFELPGTDAKIFERVPNTTAVEVQNMANLALYHIKPGQAVVITGIDNS